MDFVEIPFEPKRIVYRYSDCSTDYGVRIDLHEYTVEKETPCGFWIELYPGRKRFINTKAKKKFAYPTKEEAMESFKKRKEFQIKILENQLGNAKSALWLAERKIIT